mgnify:CR=1 FL=1
MPLDLGEISTGVDALIKLVRDSGRIEINEAALKMGLSRSVLEEWASVLEEQGLIKIEYQLTKMYLIWIAKTKSEMEVKAAEIADRRAAAVRQAESQLEEVLELSRELDAIREEYSKISELFESKMGGARRRLEKLKELRRQKEELNFRISELTREYQSRLEALRKRIGETEKLVEENAKSEEELQKKLEELTPKVMRERMARGEVEQLMKELSEREKGYGRLAKSLEALRRDIEGEKQELARVRKELDSKVGELELVSRKSDEETKKAVEQIDAELAAAKELTKDFDARDEKMHRISAELKMLEREKKELSAHLTRMIEEIRALDFTKGKMGMDDVLKAIEKAKERLAELEKRKERYEHKQKELGGLLRKIWQLEGKGG